jgi:transcriptional regulator with XRE-family HTH domain
MAAQLGADPYRYAASLLPVELADQPQAFHRTVAARLCAQRIRARLTQKALAAVAGVHPSTIRRIERGRTVPRLRLLLALCAALLALAEAQRGPRAARDVPVGTSWAFTSHRTLAELMREEPSEERIEAGINAFYASDVDQRSPFSVRDTVIAVWRAMRTARAAA